MADQLVYDLERVLGFMKAQLPGLASTEDMRGIGLERRGELVAGALYEGINEHNCWMHVAAKPGITWLGRRALAAAFAYPFKVCGVQRISGYVDASNQAAREFDEGLGFREEARLKGAAKDGGDVIVYVMWRDECRYLED